MTSSTSTTCGARRRLHFTEEVREFGAREPERPLAATRTRDASAGAARRPDGEAWMVEMSRSATKLARGGPAATS